MTDEATTQLEEARARATEIKARIELLTNNPGRSSPALVVSLRYEVLRLEAGTLEALPLAEGELMSHRFHYAKEHPINACREEGCGFPIRWEEYTHDMGYTENSKAIGACENGHKIETYDFDYRYVGFLMYPHSHMAPEFVLATNDETLRKQIDENQRARPAMLARWEAFVAQANATPEPQVVAGTAARNYECKYCQDTGQLPCYPCLRARETPAGPYTPARECDICQGSLSVDCRDCSRADEDFCPSAPL